MDGPMPFTVRDPAYDIAAFGLTLTQVTRINDRPSQIAVGLSLYTAHAHSEDSCLAVHVGLG